MFPFFLTRMYISLISTCKRGWLFLPLSIFTTYFTLSFWVVWENRCLNGDFAYGFKEISSSSLYSSIDFLNCVPFLSFFAFFCKRGYISWIWHMRGKRGCARRRGRKGVSITLNAHHLFPFFFLFISFTFLLSSLFITDHISSKWHQEGGGWILENGQGHVLSTNPF